MFELNGKSYSLDQLQKSAQKQGVDFNDFMSTMRSRGMVEKTAEPVFGRSDSISLFDNSQSTYGGTIEGVEEQKQKVINYRNTKKSIYEIGRGYFDALNTGWQTGTVLEEYLEVFKGNHSAGFCIYIQKSNKSQWRTITRRWAVPAVTVTVPTA